MNNIASISKPVTFDVEVTHAIAQDKDDRTMWVAECDALHLVTEHETYEGLVARVWEVVPDVIEANNLSISPADLRLRFSHVDSVAELLAL
ncbi:MAG: DUF1902 domain-containing protein [Azoarcus sp.]|jgi:hypothetical protein|nr:DUF1902 domain-containing protein [Azoarcus sp.]